MPKGGVFQTESSKCKGLEAGTCLVCSEVVMRPLAGVMEGEAVREVTGWQEGTLWGPCRLLYDV